MHFFQRKWKSHHLNSATEIVLYFLQLQMQYILVKVMMLINHDNWIISNLIDELTCNGRICNERERGGEREIFGRACFKLYTETKVWCQPVYNIKCSCRSQASGLKNSDWRPGSYSTTHWKNCKFIAYKNLH